MNNAKVIIITLLLVLVPSILFFGLSSGLELAQRSISKDIKLAINENQDIIIKLQLLGMDKTHSEMLTSEEATLYTNVKKINSETQTLQFNDGELKITLYSVFFNGDKPLDKIRILVFYQWLKMPLSPGRAGFRITLPEKYFLFVKDSEINTMNIGKRTGDSNLISYNFSYKNFKPDRLETGLGAVNIFPFTGIQDGWLSMEVSLITPSENFNYNIGVDFLLNYKKFYYEAPYKTAQANVKDWNFNTDLNFKVECYLIISV